MPLPCTTIGRLNRKLETVVCMTPRALPTDDADEKKAKTKPLEKEIEEPEATLNLGGPNWHQRQDEPILVA